MVVATDYTGISYYADGETAYTWNALTGPGKPVIVTYYFAEGAVLDGYWAESGRTSGGYYAFTEAQRANFRDALAVYAAAAGIVFVETTSGDAMINVLRTTGSGWGGWASVPVTTSGYTSTGKLVVDNTGAFDEGSYGFHTMLHELGHAVGLEHPWEGDVTLDPALDSQDNTVMTYNITSPYATALGSLDVAAIRQLYGAASATAGWGVEMVAGVLRVTGTATADAILGVAGANLVFGMGGADDLHGRQANDTLRGGAGADILAGNAGSDRLMGEGGNDRLYGFEVAAGYAGGEDALFGGAGQDTLVGGSGADRLYGGAGRDVLDGRDGADSLYGGLDDDQLFGGIEGDKRGSHSLYGDAGNDLLSGGKDGDWLYGGTEADTLSGGDGGDILDAGSGNDVLDGGAGWDTLSGGEGDDRLTGGGSGAVVDRFNGGAGADVFVFSAADAKSTMYLEDFTQGEDRIELSGMGLSFADLTRWSTWVKAGEVYINTPLATQLTEADFIF